MPRPQKYKVVCNDVGIGTKEDSDISYGVSDGISFVGFETPDKANYEAYAPCYGIDGSSGTRLAGESPYDYDPPKLNDTFYPGQFVITSKLDAYKSWGSCYIADDGGIIKTASYSKRLVLSKGLTLEGYKHEKLERVGIKFIEVTVVEDV